MRQSWLKAKNEVMGLTLWANPVIEQQAQHRREENAKSKNTLRLHFYH
jgi:hypothetical protein